jgi:phosphodiesterase/alkaline phosphatase D-like protein
MKTPSITNSINWLLFYHFVKVSIHPFTVWVLAQMMTADVALSHVLTHGPVVGGVTASTANVFVRTDQQATVVLSYGTDPNLGAYLISETFQTSSANDFTKIIPLINLTGETTYYINVVVNGVPQSASPPYPSFTTFAPTGTSKTFNFVVLTDFGTVSKLTESVQTFTSAASENPAFVFIGGDFDHRNPQTLGDKRQTFKDLYDANTRYMGDFVNLILRKTPIIHQWDDHDSGLNNVDKTYPPLESHPAGVSGIRAKLYASFRHAGGSGRNSAMPRRTFLSSIVAASEISERIQTTLTRVCSMATILAPPANSSG